VSLSIYFQKLFLSSFLPPTAFNGNVGFKDGVMLSLSEVVSSNILLCYIYPVSLMLFRITGLYYIFILMVVAKTLICHVQFILTKSE
jgi:hypothetical protein